ncbi:MAG: DUF3592 domain-containing protein [Desulfovibrionaceae bacterium]
MNPDVLVEHFGTLVVFLPLFVGSVFGLVLSGWGLARRLAMRRFVATPARLGAVRAEQRVHKGFLTRREHVVDLLVEYDYEFGQMTYRAKVEREAATGRRAEPVPEEVMDEAVAAMRAAMGSGVFTVWVDPKRPELSVLEQPEARREMVAVAIFAVLAGVFGALTASLIL